MSTRDVAAGALAPAIAIAIAFAIFLAITLPAAAQVAEQSTGQPAAVRSAPGPAAQDALLPPSAETPNLGVPATEDQTAGWDLSIGPNGENLPPGSGTAATGADLYAEKCIACHGAEGAGQPNDRLAGGHGTLTDASPVRTIGSFWPYATTVFDYVRRAMPYTQPQSLTADEVYALTAYLLFVNDVIDEDFVADAESLPRIEMPNRENFRAAYPNWQN